jgi:small subunit ribosomal protein S4
MARYTEASCKKCRKLDMKLFLKGSKCYSNCVFDKNSRGKGGKKFSFRSKKSEYAVRLNEKQKARLIAGVTEKPFANYFTKASKTAGKTGETFLRFLEVRLDNIVKRLGFATSLQNARQLVSHGHVKVNDRVVTIASYQVKPGDKITLTAKTKQNVLVKQGLEESQKRSLRPTFLELDEQSFVGKLVRWPERDEMSYPVQERLIIEYYSK